MFGGTVCALRSTQSFKAYFIYHTKKKTSKKKYKVWLINHHQQKNNNNKRFNEIYSFQNQLKKAMRIYKLPPHADEVHCT